MPGYVPPGEHRTYYPGGSYLEIPGVDTEINYVNGRLMITRTVTDPRLIKAMRAI